MNEPQDSAHELTTRRIGAGLRDVDLAAERPAAAAFENPDRRGTVLAGAVVGGVLVVLVGAIAFARSGPEAKRVEAGLGDAVTAAASVVEQAIALEAQAAVVEEPPPKPKAVARRKEPATGSSSVAASQPTPAEAIAPAAAPAPAPAAAPTEPASSAALPSVKDEPEPEPAPTRPSAPPRETE